MAGKSLGVLSLDVLVSIGAFEKGMDRAARITDKRFKEMERQAKQFGKALGIGIASAASAVAFGMGLYIRNTIEAEKVQAQLASRIKDTGGAAQRSLGQLNEMADKLMGMTIFDDEAIGGVQAMLLTFKQIQGVNFDAATGAVLDLATAMGTDANAAALQLGKALNDPIKGVTALAKAGVQFSTDQKAMIKSLVETGDIAGAQRVILRELEGQMGTAAEAAKGTLGGALQGLKNAFDNVLEGDAGSDGIRGATKAVNDFTDTLNDPDIKKGVDNAANGLIRMANGAVSLIAKLGQAGGAIAEFYGAMDKRSLNVLNSQILEAEDKVFALQRRLKTTANVPFAGAIDAAQLKAAREELEALERARGRAIGLASAEKLAAAAAGAGAAVLGLPEPVSPASASGGAKTKATGKDDAAKRAEEAAKAMREAAAAQQEWHNRVLDMSASLEGPAAEVLRDYDKSMAELNGQFQDGKVRLDDYAKAQEMLAEIRDQDLKGIKDQVTPYQEVNAAIAEQIKLLGMSAEKQEVYNNLKAAGVAANSLYGQSIIQNTEELQRAREASAFYMDVAEGLTDSFMDFVDGSKSAKDAFGDFADQLFKRALQFVADKAIQAMFDAFSNKGQPEVAIGAGTMGGGGGWGGFIQSIMGIFGGGRASGGGVNAGMFYRVNENGPEMLSVSGKDYLMMGNQSGVVTPNRGGRGGGVVNHNNFTLRAPTSQETQEQIAQRIHYETNLAHMRNR